MNPYVKNGLIWSLWLPRLLLVIYIGAMLKVVKGFDIGLRALEPDAPIRYLEEIPVDPDLSVYEASQYAA